MLCEIGRVRTAAASTTSPATVYQALGIVAGGKSSLQQQDIRYVIVNGEMPLHRTKRRAQVDFAELHDNLRPGNGLEWCERRTRRRGDELPTRLDQSVR